MMYDEIKRGYGIYSARGTQLGHLLYAVDVLAFAKASADGDLIIVTRQEFDHEHLEDLIKRDGRPAAIDALRKGY
jgi:hypothetical protein